MAKNKRYEYIAGPFGYWKEASEWSNGYNAAKGVSWKSPEAVSYKLMNDMYDGYMEGKFSANSGFYVVRTIILTVAQKKAIDQKELEKKAKKAEENAISAVKEAQRLQKMLRKEELV